MGTASKEIEMELPCTLSERELASRSLMLADTVALKDDTSKAMRETAKEYRDKLTGLEDRQRILATTLNTGIERRNVRCRVFFHTPAEASKRIVRMDTGEIVKEEAMSAAECQLHMFASQADFASYMQLQDIPPDPPPESPPQPPEEEDPPAAE